MLKLVFNSIVNSSIKLPIFTITKCSFHRSIVSKGLEDFYDQKKPTEVLIAGRSWTVSDLRRKVYH